MILEARARKVGKLADHLARIGRDANKRVAVRSDFVRHCPNDIKETLRLCAAYSRTVGGVTRDFVHLKISPNHELSDAELATTLAAYESEYGISPTAPRHVTQHWKGDRPSHLHVVYAMVDPGTGKALRLWRSFERDEAIARTLEIRFGEPITATIRAERVAELLRQRGEHAVAAAVVAGPRAERHRNVDKIERSQATRREADLAEVDGRLLALWHHSGTDLRSFMTGLDAAGFQVARGDKVIMLIDLEGGVETALAKHLNRVTKAAGQAARVKEAAVRELVGSLPGLVEARAAVAAQAPQRARDAVAREFELFRREADVDEDGLAEDDDRMKRAWEKNRRPEVFLDPAETKARILADCRRRDRIRRARVGRAFLMARLLGSRDVRRLAFFLAGAGAIMTGAGLVAAFAAAGIAVSALPTYDKAHRARRQAREERELDLTEKRRELAIAAAAARAHRAREARAGLQAQALMRPRVDPDRLRRDHLVARANREQLDAALRQAGIASASIRARAQVRPDGRRGDPRGQGR